MTIGVGTLSLCINSNISNANANNRLEVLQLSSAVKDFEEGYVYSVANTSSLPAAANNKGRLVYVQDICGYRISDGTQWTNNFSSSFVVTSSQIWTCGTNSDGRLGDGTTSNQTSFVPVVGGFTDWCQVSIGRNSSFGIRSNGTLWSWGLNNCGQLADGTINNRSSPVSVVGGFTDWCKVSASTFTQMGLRSNGTIWTWGCGYGGTLGNGVLCQQTSSPVSVAGGFTDWCEISAGGNHLFGIRTNGTLWTWGSNFSGSLGIGCMGRVASPVTVVGGFTDWCKVSASGNSSSGFTLGLRSNGTLWAWGGNNSGTLGDGTIIDRSSPVSVVGGFTDWTQIGVGYVQSFAIRSNGTLWSWGGNTFCSLGDGTTEGRSSPVSVVGGFTNWCQVGGQFAVRTNGTAWRWGTSPVTAVGGFTDWCQVCMGGYGAHVAGIRASGKGF